MGSYSAADDIDFGLLNEEGHQLGLIDIYQLDVAPELNLVSAMGRSAVDELMRGNSPFLSDFSALAMQHWLREAHGYFGPYMYSIPDTMQLRILGYDGQPLPGATGKVYQYVAAPLDRATKGLPDAAQHLDLSSRHEALRNWLVTITGTTRGNLSDHSSNTSHLGDSTTDLESANQHLRQLDAALETIFDNRRLNPLTYDPWRI